MPRKAATKHRIGLAAVTFFLLASVGWLWPDGTQAVAKPDAPTSTEWPYLLDFLIGFPIVAGLFVLFLPRQMPSLLRGVTYAVFAVSFVASLALLAVPMTPGWHFQHIVPWIESAGIRWHVATDGISVWLIVLTTFTTPIAAFASFGSIKSRHKELCAAFLMLQGAMIGAFVALDLFVFYVFWELMLVPMFLMIGIWGGAEKIKASVKFFLFTMTGSVLMLGAMLYLVWTHHELTSQWTFDYLALSRVVLPDTQKPVVMSAQFLCWFAFSLAFFIKVPMWPLHTWLPDAHVQAPTGGSVVLAAVMLKLGTYAYLRFSMGLFPFRSAILAGNLGAFAVIGGILYGALCAWKQDDIKKLVAYSSVAHLGFVMLGLFGATPSGIQGAILQMVNHGLATGALFLLVGVLYDRRHTREVSEFGGIAKVMPVYTVLFLIVTMASIGVPGTNGFVGEFMVIAGTFVSKRLNQFGAIEAIGAAFGVILAAVYMLGMVQKVFFGPLSNPKNKHLDDITPREALAVAPLVIMIFVIGFFPSIMTDRMRPAVESYQQQFVHLFSDTPETPLAARLLPRDMFPPSFLVGAPDAEAGGPSAVTEAATKTAAAPAKAAEAPKPRSDEDTNRARAARNEEIMQKFKNLPLRKAGGEP
ncbi:MAG: NADH-quinone oxidoreductase subunit M [Deltaproteobacteria bacterium]|nr:NADH-quinone oxidoreductase subunit M [Deltaproteobacteria bacterium]